MTKIVVKRRNYVSLARTVIKIAVQFFFGLPFIKDKTIKDKNAREVVRLYKAGEYAGLSSKIRFWDAPLQELEKIIPKSGVILDLGCGEGVLTNYLAICSRERKLTGIEFNRDRIKAANHGIENTQFIYADVLKKKLPKSDVIVMSHLLHHLPSKEDQIKLINNCYKSLKKDGKLIVAEVNKSASFKYFLGWITDVFIVPILFENQIYDTHIFHRSKKEWEKVFKENKFIVKNMFLTRDGPFPDLLITCQKKTQ